jgi:hypothetical protein
LYVYERVPGIVPQNLGATGTAGRVADPSIFAYTRRVAAGIKQLKAHTPNTYQKRKTYTTYIPHIYHIYTTYIPHIYHIYLE